jgi:1-acyl-sn-glycerol-3-phosphate acyltransferase
VHQLSAVCLPAPPGIFFANHSSHLDFAVLWAALPRDERRRTRPVAGRDYWEATPLRRWIARRVFCAVLIERQKVTAASNPLVLMLAALDTGRSLIVFPEGTRSTDGVMHDFKPGLFHLARARPAIPLVPVYLENLNRMLPKGDIMAVPLIASVTVGPPLHLDADENKLDFLARARQAVAALHADP